MKPEKVICANCVFYALEWSESGPNKVGRCWRFPKRKTVFDWEWCGEWSDTWPAGWIEHEEPPEPETVEVFQFLGGGSLPK